MSMWRAQAHSHAPSGSGYEYNLCYFAGTVPLQKTCSKPDHPVQRSPPRAKHLSSDAIERLRLTGIVLSQRHLRTGGSKYTLAALRLAVLINLSFHFFLKRDRPLFGISSKLYCRLYV